MKWVTWESVGVDRIGCAWLIRREIDPEAKFLFIAAGSAVPPHVEPFDIPGVKYSHHGGHCSFHALVEQHQLQDPILHRIARIIDEADTIQPASVEPSSQGLDLICQSHCDSEFCRQDRQPELRLRSRPKSLPRFILWRIGRDSLILAEFALV